MVIYHAERGTLFLFIFLFSTVVVAWKGHLLQKKVHVLNLPQTLGIVLLVLVKC